LPAALKALKYLAAGGPQMRNRVIKAKTLNMSRKVKWLFENNDCAEFDKIMEVRGALQGNVWTLAQYNEFRKQVEASDLTLGEWLATEEQQ